MVILKKRFIAITLSAFLAIVPAIGEARVPPDGFADLAEKLMPAVVNISSTQKLPEQPARKLPLPMPMPELPPGTPFEDFRDFFEQLEPPTDDQGNPIERKATSLGSGFIIDSSGYIVTNNHVINNAEEIVVNFSDDTQAKAKVIGFDSKTDLALLKVDVDRKLPSVEFGDSDHARVGDWVLAIGNPFGLGGSVSAGIISARARDINAGPFDDFLQTDAAINRGNSGGPMFNMDGKVIGINTAIYSPSGGSVGIGFSVPSSMAEPVIKQLKQHGRIFRGWLGVKIQTVTEDIAESLGLKKAEGALVVEVSKDSPAEKAGIQVGDVITSYNSKDVHAMRKLPRFVAETPIGESVRVTIWRKGDIKTVNVTIGELKEEEPATANKNADKQDENIAGTIELLHMKIVTLNGEIRKRFSISDSIAHGVLILSVDSRSNAASKGLKAGDVITTANQAPLTSVEQLGKVIEQAKSDKRKSILLLINRNGETIFIALPLEEDEKKE